MRDILLEEQMKLVRHICKLGHEERKRINIKVRQPLASITLKHTWKKLLGEEGDRFNQLTGLIKDELNVKEVFFREK